MEDYKQRYEKALEQAKKELETCGSQDCDAAKQIFRLFPELKKSEGERIKDNIINLLRFVRDIHHQYLDECIEAIDWLKKQSNDTKYLENDEIKKELIHFLETCQDPRFFGNRKQEKWIKWLENIPTFDMPKIKFKVGDWVTFIHKSYECKSIYQVEKIENYAYILRHILGGSMPLTFYSQDLIRPWTLEDAKDGDILVDESKIFIYKWHVNNEIGFYASFSTKGENNLLFDGISFGNLNTIKNIHPATKEQRDLLLQKIKEAGYEWNAAGKRFKWICG